jgi:predicted dehydrogenase
MDPVRFGLVGYGFGGPVLPRHRLLAAAPEVRVPGVVTTSAERRELVAASTPARAFDSLEALVAAGAEAVAISTPPAPTAP